MDCGLPGDAPVVVVEQPAKESELTLTVQDFDLHEVGKLTCKCMYLLVEPRQFVLNLRAKQDLHAVVGELRSQFTNGSSRIAEESGEGRADAALRARAFQNDGIEDFNLIEMVAFRLKELSSLVDGGVYNRIAILGKGDVGAVRFEEILIDVEAGTEGFQGRFEPLNRIFLFRVVKTFVVHTGDTENHAHIATLREKGCLVPESVQIDVVIERRALFPRFDDLIEP